MYGANINVKDKFGNSPLILAIENNSLESINSLMKNGCDREDKNIYGKTAIDKAKYKNNILDFIERYPKMRRKFPKFKVQLDIQKKLSHLWEEIDNYKVFKYKINIYPFNNFKGHYKLNLNDSLTINEVIDKKL